MLVGQLNICVFEFRELYDVYLKITSLALASEISQKLNYSIIINLVKITITLLLFQLHMSQLIQGALPIHTLP